MALKDVLSLDLSAAALPPAADCVLLRSLVFGANVLRYWNFSRMDDSLLWYWLTRSVEVSAPPEPAAAYLAPVVPPPKRLTPPDEAALALALAKSLADWVFERPVELPNLLPKRLPVLAALGSAAAVFGWKLGLSCGWSRAGFTLGVEPGSAIMLKEMDD